MSPPSVRSEYRALVDDRIMQGVALLLKEGGGDLTYRSLATASGVPERTLFRHHPTKTALLAAFWKWLNARLQMPAAPSSPDEFVAQIPTLFTAFDVGETLVRAMLHEPNGRETRLSQATERRSRVRKALEEPLRGMKHDKRVEVLASIQLLASAVGWESMKDNWGLTGEQAAKAAQWAVQALLQAAAQEAPADRETL